MRVIIIGAGDVGSYLARVLSRETQVDVTLVDQNGPRLQELADQLDIAVVHGSGTLQSVLEKAGAKGADYLVAATNIDEINLLACMAGERLGVANRIARIRSDELTEEIKRLGQATLTVNPEKAAAKAIMDLLLHSAVKDYSDFLGGQIRMISLTVEKGGPLDGRNLIKLAQKYDRISYRIVARVSQGLTSIPRGEDVLRAGDTVTFAVRSRDSVEIFRMTGIADARSRHVMILGSSRIAVAVAEDLQKVGGANVKLFTTHTDTWISEYDLAERLPRIDIFSASGKEIDTMAQHALGDMDVLLSLTGDEEDNIITCLVAKHLGVKRTITLVRRADYMPIIKTIGLDVGINERLIAAQEILRYIRVGQLQQRLTLSGSGALVASFRIPPESRLCKQPIARLDLPEQALLAGIQRRGAAFVPRGQDQVEPGDLVMVVTLDERLPDLEKYFG
ncbi:MAG: Trk system potassium transporter TrkA [bacterium]|jgi:trk system potassium uptake protein TrkA|nr:Trk system potassium transporter TrkA [bacterium]